MNGTDNEWLLTTALAWQQQGLQPLLVTVLQTWGSAPRPAGSLLVMTASGQHQGSVSGGCVEENLFTRCQAGEWQHLTLPQLIRYGVDAQEAARFGLPCGGQLELLVEPLHPVSLWHSVRDHIAQGKVVLYQQDWSSGQAHLHYPPDDRPSLPAVQLEGTILYRVFGPQWRLLLIGANHLARYVAQFAQALEYQVWVCDPRDSYRNQWDVPYTRWLEGMPDDAVLALGHYQRTAILTLTHDPKLDDMALMEALYTEAFYIGALGSKRSSVQRRARLQSLGLSPAQIDRLHAPVGLDIGSRTPAEIAIAILAELVAHRRG